MKNYKDILLSPGSTIREALKVIDSGAIKIGVVVDENEKLVGTITDGDIRRGILNNLSLDDTIDSVVCKTPTVCKIDDSKEKILEIAVDKKLYQIPIIDSKGKLVGIEEVDELLKPKYKNSKVVLMTGGLGTRLKPLTNETPKPMLKVGDKPLLESIISGFKKYGFTEIILSVSYKSEIIENYFGDGSNFGVSIKYIHENKRMGTAGTLNFMRELLSEPFFVMNGDLLTNINFEHMMDYHIENSSVATMGVREYDFQVPYGVVNLKGVNIKGIIEKPMHSFYVSGGVYVLDAKVLDFVPENEFFDMPTLFEKVIDKNLKCISFPIREYWLDIGIVADYERANREFSSFFINKIK
jgi:dTDP-glucose pyrophosphorylase/predicted transcriptional regulator